MDLEISIALVLHHAAVQKDITITQGLSALCYASQRGLSTAVAMILDIGHSVRDTIHGRGPLHYACESGHEEVVRLLLAQYPEANFRDNLGHTPLSLALKANHEAVVHLLQESGFTTGGTAGPPPLHDALNRGREGEA